MDWKRSIIVHKPSALQGSDVTCTHGHAQCALAADMCALCLLFFLPWHYALFKQQILKSLNVSASYTLYLPVGYLLNLVSGI